MRAYQRKGAPLTAHVLRFPRPGDQAGDFASFISFVRLQLQARADIRLSCVPDHVLAPATDAGDAAISRVMRRYASRIAEVECAVRDLLDQLDREVQR